MVKRLIEESIPVSEHDDRMITDTLEQLRLLVDWACRLRVEDIPREALACAALGIADDVAVATSTQDEPEVSRFHALLLGDGGAAQATVFRAGAPRADRHSAAVANALAMSASELAGIYQFWPCHGGLYTIPALSAEAEAGNLSVLDVLRAEVLAYEIITRISRAWKSPRGAYGPVYGHGRLSALGAAAATALARGLETDVFLRSLSNAATLANITPRDHSLRGALVRDAWPAAGAWSGMMSVRWAQCGIGGLPSSPHDVFCGVLGYIAAPQELGAALGADWTVLHIRHRVHACPAFFNGLIEAMLELRPRVMASSLDEIERIAVEIHADALELVDRSPATTLAARFSLPHVTASTLFNGHAGADAFSAATLEQPGIDRLRQIVAATAFDMSKSEGHRWPAAVSITMRGGAVHRARCLAPTGAEGVQHPHETILRKIDVVTATRHPLFGACARELVVLDPRRLEGPWAHYIREALGT